MSADMVDLLGPLLQCGTTIEVPPGTLLFSRGDPADRFFVVHQGQVKLFAVDADGSETVFQVFGSGAVFGLPAMIGLRYYPVDCEATQRTRIAAVSRQAAVAWLSSHPARLHDLLAALAGRYVHLADDLALLKVASPTERICGQFLRLAVDLGLWPLEDDGDAGAEIHLPWSRALLASRVGIAPENLSRALVRLRGDGIRLNGRTVRVASLQRLNELAGRAAPPRDPAG